MKQRFWVFIIVLVSIVIIVIAASSSSGPPKKATADTPSMSVTVVIVNNIGVESIEIKNLNTGKIYTATLISLPLAFNVTRGDYLQTKVSMQPGYKWNAWWFSPIDKFVNDNPAIICANGDIVTNNMVIMRPDCLIAPVEQPENQTGTG